MKSRRKRKRKRKKEEEEEEEEEELSPTIDQCCSFVIQEISSVAKIKKKIIDFSCKEYGAVERSITSGDAIMRTFRKIEGYIIS